MDSKVPNCPSFLTLLSHITLQSPENIVAFIRSLSDLLLPVKKEEFPSGKKSNKSAPALPTSSEGIKNYEIKKQINVELEHHFGTVVTTSTGNDPPTWFAQLDNVIPEETKKKCKYDGHVLFSLLRFMRNTINHIQEYPENMRLYLGSTEEEAIIKILQKFPNFLQLVYVLAQPIKSELGKFYNDEADNCQDQLPLEYIGNQKYFEDLTKQFLFNEAKEGRLVTRYQLKNSKTIQFYRPHHEFAIDPDTIMVRVDNGCATVTRFQRKIRDTPLVQEYLWDPNSEVHKSVLIFTQNVEETLKRLDPDDDFNIIVVSNENYNCVDRIATQWLNSLGLKYQSSPLYWKELAIHVQQQVMQYPVKIQGTSVTLSQIVADNPAALDELAGPLLYDLISNANPELLECVTVPKISPYYVHCFKDFDMLPVTNEPVVITGVAGIGKTTALMKIANELSTKSKRVVLCLSISRLAENFGSAEALQLTCDKVVRKIVDLFCTTKFSRKLLKTLILGDIGFDLMFDAFDEIQQGQYELASDILKLMADLRQSSNTRLWITSRPNYSNHLQDLFGIPPLTIPPLKELHSVEIIKEYWKSTKTNLADDSKLNSLAHHCFNAVEKSVLCTPFVCVSIANIFDGYLQEDNSHMEAIVPVVSIVNLYERLLDKKAEEYFRKQIVEADVTLSSAPAPVCSKKMLANIRETMDWTHAKVAFKSLLPHKDQNRLSSAIKAVFKNVDTSKVGEYGLVIEDNGGISLKSTGFLHVSFAEYYFAWFMHKMITLVDNDESYFPEISSYSTELFIDNIVKLHPNGGIVCTLDPLDTRHFLDIMLENGVLNYNKHFMKCLAIELEAMDTTDAEKSSGVLEQRGVFLEEEGVLSLFDMFLVAVILFLPDRPNILNVVLEGVSMMKEECKERATKHVQLLVKSASIQLSEENYQKLTQMLKNHGHIVPETKVSQPFGNLFMDILTSVLDNMVEISYSSQERMKWVQVKNELIKSGATSSDVFDFVVYIYTNKSFNLENINKAQEGIAKIVKHWTKVGEDPNMASKYIIKIIERLDMLYKQPTSGIDSIMGLISRLVDWTGKNERDMTILHVVADITDEKCSSAEFFHEVLKYLVVVVGSGVECRDKFGKNVLHYAVKRRPLLRETLELLKEHGLDFNAQDNEEKTVLDIASNIGERNEFLQLLQEYCCGLVSGEVVDKAEEKVGNTQNNNIKIDLELELD